MNKNDTLEILEKEPPRKPAIMLRYRRGLILVQEIGVFAALPFMFFVLGFILPFGLIWLGGAVASLLGAPILAYDSFAASTQKKIKVWIDNEHAKD